MTNCEDCERKMEEEDSRTSKIVRMNRFRFFNLFIALLVVISCAVLVSSEEQQQFSNVVSQSEVKTIEPTNNPTKVFVRRRIFRKIVKDSNATSNEESEPTTTRPRTLYSLVKRLDNDSPTSTVTGNTLKSSMSTSIQLSSKQKFNFASLKTRLGLAATEMTTTQSTTTSSTEVPKNDSLVMIPLPPNQRKPYQPVIMQVTKSTTAKPTTQTYKLNKMFVPIGIYGKVLENSSETTSTPATEIRHKGTDSGEQERKQKGIADTVDITYGKPNLGRYSLTTEKPDVASISITTEANDLFGSVMNGLRRGDHQHRPYSNSGLTLMTPPKLGIDQEAPSTLSDSLSSYSSYSSYSPHKSKFTPSSMLDSITDSMSKIPSLVPSLFHKGLTSLTSLTSSLKENPFVDDNFSDNLPKKNVKPIVSGYNKPKIPASVPGGYINGVKSSKDQSYAGSEIETSNGGVDISEYETLEYFRKRPYLLAQLQKQQGSWRRGGGKDLSSGFRMSKGFKPATAPDLLAREYYKSTSTTQMTPDEPPMRKSKSARGSWLMRNSNEYVTNKNERLVKMWRNMLESFTDDDDNEQETYDQLSKSTIASRRSSVSRKSSKKSPLLSSYWSSIKNKYSKGDINEAKERILTLLNSGYGDDALFEEQLVDEEELQQSHVDYDDTASHMPPPPPPPKIKSSVSLTKGLSGAASGAFKDLVKFFKLGVSVGAGQAKEPVNYEQVVDLQEEEENDWKPIRRPLISFSAGISLKNPSSSTKKPYHHYHYSTSPLEVEPDEHFVSPVVSYSKPSLSSYIDEFASHHQTSKPVSYAVYDPQPQVPQTLDYEEEEEEPQGSNTQSYVANPPSRYSTTSRPNYYDYSTLKSGRYQNWTPVTQDPASEYELVPSSLYLNGQNDPRDIAAVVKPAGVSDDLVKQYLPAGLRNLRILDYPNEYASLNSISQALAPSQSGPSFKEAMKKLRQNYVAKETAYLPPAGGLEEIEAPQQIYQQTAQKTAASSVPYSYSLPQATLQSAYFSPLNQQFLSNPGETVFATANRINNMGKNGVNLHGAYSLQQPQKDQLGFTTNYNLPQSLDPDIAAILKSELDKDDIPEDIRQEFLEAKEEEKKKKQASRRVDDAQQSLIDSLLNSAIEKSRAAAAKPSYTSAAPLPPSTTPYYQPTQPTPIHQSFAQSRSYRPGPPVPPMPQSPPVVATRFFAPIPITPTLMTMAMRNPRYSSPVPRYVIELAKKLQTDKSVQGIVRVSAKRGRGLPPIEYLYPVKG